MLVPQIDDFDDFADTDLFADTALDSISVIQPFQPLVNTSRAVTSSDWPPAPPLPATVDEWAVGTDSDRMPAVMPTRRAGIYAAVRRPSTAGDT